jgi:predicted acylesterase/phospholipase RssA
MADRSVSGAPRSRIGLALAGGGPEGAVYEIGALRALDEALEGVDLNDLHIHVGVSAGAFIAAFLANGITTAELCRSTAEHDPAMHPFFPGTLFRPAFKEFGRRGLMAPRLLLEALRDYAVGKPADRTLFQSAMRLGRALPAGIFDNEPIRAYLEKTFAFGGRTDDFRDLRNRLIVVAADLDSGRPVRFGEPGLDHVPISLAVQASSALPGLYPPVLIDGRYFVDGVLLKTLHGSVALDAGADLLLCVNPLVPVDTDASVSAGVMRRGKLVNRGLPSVLSQTFRTLIHSRLTVGLASYEPRYPESDIVLIEPRRDDYRMFFTNVFSFSSRKAICEHAYRSIRRQLLERREELEPILERHGARLRTEVLEDAGRDPWAGVGLREPARARTVAGDLDRALSRLERTLEDL